MRSEDRELIDLRYEEYQNDLILDEIEAERRKQQNEEQQMGN